VQVATTLRLPQELDERLTAYCENSGAVKNRVTVLALRDYLDGRVPEREQEFVDVLRSEFDARVVE
jgi:predicted DNA-binding protein